MDITKIVYQHNSCKRRYGKFTVFVQFLQLGFHWELQ